MACKKWLPLSDSMVLVGKSKCTWQVVDIDPMSLPWVNDMNVCEALDDCQTIKNLKSKDVNLQHQIDELIIEKNKLIEKDKDLQDQIDDNNERDDSQDQIITQINTEISSLKTNYITVINKLNSLWVNVILDETYNSFEDWIENVYIPACWTAENEFSEWDWYINTNPSIDSEQWVWVNIRDKESTEPCSINDWYKLPYDIPELAIIWIDPIKVVHPYRWRFEVSIDQDKLADFISKLDHLDLSSVKLYLGDVYLDWVIKESLHIQEDLTVDNTTNTQNINVTKNANIQNLYAEEWCIKVHKCDEKFLWDVNIEWDINAINAHYDGNVDVDGSINIEWHTETDTIHAREWCIERFTCDTDHTWYNIIVWDTEINNTNVNSPVAVHNHLHVHQDAHFDWHVVINSNSFNYQDPDTWEIVCLQNMIKNAFTPSYWFFTFNWSSSFSASAAELPDTYTTTCVPLCQDDLLREFNQRQQQWQTQAVWYINSNRAKIQCLRDSNNQTSWVWFEDWTQQRIVIHWENDDYKWVYRITYQLTMWFWLEWWIIDLYAHRSWIIVVDASDYNNYTVYDDKHATWRDNLKYTHNHTYRDWNNWDYASWWNRDWLLTSSHTMQSIHRWESSYIIPEWYDWLHFLWDDHYTYSVSVELPIDKKVFVIPFFKSSSWIPSNPATWTFTITEWRWVNWWVSRLSIVKTCNLWEPADSHCEWN